MSRETASTHGRADPEANAAWNEVLGSQIRQRLLGSDCTSHCEAVVSKSKMRSKYGMTPERHAPFWKVTGVLAGVASVIVGILAWQWPQQPSGALPSVVPSADAATAAPKPETAIGNGAGSSANVVNGAASGPGGVVINNVITLPGAAGVSQPAAPIAPAVPATMPAISANPPPARITAPQKLSAEEVSQCLRVRADGMEGLQNYCAYPVSFKWCWRIGGDRNFWRRWKQKENSCQGQGWKQAKPLGPNGLFDWPTDPDKPTYRDYKQPPVVEIVEAFRLPA